MAKHRRRNRMPAGLRRYWASHSHRRRRRSNPHRRARTRTHTIVRYRTRRANRSYRRYRNPGFGGFSGTDLIYAGGGALVNGIISRTGPQMLLPNQNKGMVGYALNVAFGAAGAWAIGRFNRRAGQGAWIGMIVALGQRVIAEQFGAGSAAATAGMSGDMDFDLGYYVNDRFPFPQGGAGGPWDAFPGSPYSGGGPFPATSAAAVRAGAAAAVAALPAAAGAGIGPAAMPAAMADRWNSAWT